jgi:hypothetical protein
VADIITNVFGRPATTTSAAWITTAADAAREFYGRINDDE